MKAMRNQKVLLVHNYYQIPGGEDTVFANEEKLLKEHGHEVVLYTRHNDELKGMNALQKLGLPFTTIFNPRTYRDIKRIIREKGIELVHVHNTLNLISPAVYYAAVKMKVPVFQTIHNFRFLCPGATFFRNGHICEECVDKGLSCAIKYKCYRGSRVQTLVCAISTWVHRHTGIFGRINCIALTEFNRNKLLQIKHFRPENVFIKPNFTFDVACERQQKDTARKYYLYIGRIEEIKGIHKLVEAFRKMPDKELRLAGQGPLKEEYDGKDKNIHFYGQVKHEELMKMIMGAKAVILPSQWYEGFPMTITEAFSMGTPMIVGDIGNNGALVKDGVNGMKFRYDDAGDLVRTIERFENVDRDALGKRAYMDYQRLYSAEANYEMLKKIYDRAR